MNSRTAGRALACAALGFGAWTPAASSQEPAQPPPLTVRAASQMVDAAVTSMQAGDFASALDVLDEGQQHCRVAPAPDGACDRLLVYAWGYVHQLQAGRDPAARQPLLMEAAQAYEHVLSLDPGDDDAAYNLALVYRAMGAMEWHEPFLQRAAMTQGPRQAAYALMLGDYYRERGMDAVEQGFLADAFHEAAADAYRRAVELAPDDPEPAQRLISLTRAFLPSRVGELLELVPDREVRQPGIALEAVEAAIESLHDRATDDAAELLPRWLELAARTGRLDDHVLERLPRGWRPPPVEQLAAYLLDPYWPLPPSSWWLAAEERAAAIGSAALELGRRKAAAEPRLAEECWDAGRTMSPFGSERWIDLERELALLYFQHPALDPGGGKLRSLEHELFDGKAVAIGELDWAAMQRFHTTLGLIYAERGEWGPEWDARSAIYQLQRAIAAAARHAEAEGRVQPLPHLQERLAQGYEAVGQATDARSTWAAAALDHLDLDDLAGAAASVDRGRALPGRPRDRLEAAGRAFGLRQAVLAEATGAAAVSVRAAGGADPAARSRHDGVCRTLLRSDRPGLDGLPAAFRARQLFKMTADCMDALPAEDARQMAARAVIMAATGEAALVGMGDLLRLNRAHGTVQRALSQDAPPLQLRRGAPVSRPAAVPLSLPFDGLAHVPLDADALLSARVLQALSRFDSLPRLQVRDGEVLLLEPSPRWTRDELARALADVPGVRVRSRWSRAPS